MEASDEDREERMVAVANVELWQEVDEVAGVPMRMMDASSGSFL